MRSPGRPNGSGSCSSELYRSSKPAGEQGNCRLLDRPGVAASYCATSYPLDGGLTLARVTVEDCLEKVPNRFALTILAAERARVVQKGAQPLVKCDNKA